MVMKFYNREKELERINRTREVAFNNHSQMTVLTGRRRIGKTSLILKSCENTPKVYLFVSRGNETMLCNQFAQIASRELNTFISPKISSFADLFETLMGIGRNISYNLIIDEFQEFFYINESIYSQMQNIWDTYKDTTHVNLIASGSVYTLMHRIFMDYKEPLYGRCDSVMKLRPFEISVLKEILSDHKPNYTNEDLLALYTFTGGVPKYIENFIDNGCTSVDEMIDFMMLPDSLFQNEGKALLIQEFGKKYGNYFAVLSAIANGNNTIPKLSDVTGETSITGHLKRLEEDYELISRKRPIFAKEGTQTVRFEISDLFLRFWFRYFTKYNDLIETGNFELLSKIIKDDYPTYSGLTLEMYFRQKMIESKEFRNIGSWWQTKKEKNPCEIDIIGIFADDKRALVAEVKRQRKNFKPVEFKDKVEIVRAKILSKYQIESCCFSMEDM
jgi:AAA+ ATPase superfamily predicted ATPase